MASLFQLIPLKYFVSRKFGYLETPNLNIAEIFVTNILRLVIMLCKIVEAIANSVYSFAFVFVYHSTMQCIRADDIDVTVLYDKYKVSVSSAVFFGIYTINHIVSIIDVCKTISFTRVQNEYSSCATICWSHWFTSKIEVFWET